MRVYQFEYAGEYGDIVIDITAASQEEAVAEMKGFAGHTCDSDDPTTLEGTRVYARIWLKIHPDMVNERDIIDSWEEED